MLTHIPTPNEPLAAASGARSSAADDALGVIDAIAEITRHGRGENIQRRDPHAVYLSRAVSGVARDCALLADGRRHIIAFVMPGDFFGFTPRDARQFSVEAVVDDTVVAHYPLQRVEQMADANPRLGRRLREMAFDTASRSQARSLILGRLSALERVGLFLLEMGQRSTDATGTAILLPMSRYDIGDYLGLSSETVCRVLTDLKARGAITFTGAHRVRIIDTRALSERDGTGKAVAKRRTVAAA
jgi:CRP/FNR family transcriptional regulator, nitrogen fixation regulation protein